MQRNTISLTGKEKNIGIYLKNDPDSNLDSVLRCEPDASALQKLLEASKDAELLIACMFELHLITAAPLLEIWNRLAAAINEAQSTSQAEHLDAPSPHSSPMHRERRL
jgi:hypothetical protein